MKKKPLSRPEPPVATRSDSVEIVEAIVQAGRELAAQGIDSVTMSAIAKRAGVGNASLYRYFPDKGALFAEVFRRQHQAGLDALRASLADATSLEDAVRRSVESFAAFDEGEARIRRALNTDVPLSWSTKELLPVLDGVLDLVAEWLSRFLPELDKAEVQRRVFYSVGYARGVVLLRLLRPERAPTREDMIDELSAGCLRIVRGSAA